MFSSPTLIFVTNDSSLFHFIGKWNEQKEIPLWNSNIYLRCKKKCKFEKEISKMVVWSENVFKSTCSCSFYVLWLDEFCWWKISVWWTFNDFNMIDLKFCTYSFHRLLHKSVPTSFLIMSYSAFTAILWQILKSHFERKQSKTDYPKNIWKGEKCDHDLFWILAISVTKSYRKPQMCLCRSS